MQSRSAWAGLVVILLFGLVFGFGLGVLVDGPYNDPGQGSPSLAALGVVVLGIAVGLIILPVVSLVYVWRAARLSGADGAVGCLIVTVLTVTAAVFGFLLFGALPLSRWVPSC